MLYTSIDRDGHNDTRQCHYLQGTLIMLPGIRCWLRTAQREMRYQVLCRLTLQVHRSYLLRNNRRSYNSEMYCIPFKSNLFIEIFITVVYNVNFFW